MNVEENSTIIYTIIVTEDDMVSLRDGNKKSFEICGHECFLKYQR